MLFFGRGLISTQPSTDGCALDEGRRSSFVDVDFVNRCCHRALYISRADHAAGIVDDLACQAAYSPSRDFGSRNASSPKSPYSRPMPDCLKPPKGAIRAATASLLLSNLRLYRPSSRSLPQLFLPRVRFRNAGTGRVNVGRQWQPRCLSSTSMTRAINRITYVAARAADFVLAGLTHDDHRHGPTGETGPALLPGSTEDCAPEGEGPAPKLHFDVKSHEGVVVVAHPYLRGHQGADGRQGLDRRDGVLELVARRRQTLFRLGGSFSQTFLLTRETIIWRMPHSRPSRHAPLSIRSGSPMNCSRPVKTWLRLGRWRTGSGNLRHSGSNSRSERQRGRGAQHQYDFWYVE
jgi:hypothetical protein